MENILFRVDASDTLGKGHLSRCLNLANKLLNESNNIYFITNMLSSSSSILISGFGFKHFEISENSKNNGLDETLEIAKKVGPVSLIVIDHYQIGYEWEKKTSSLIPKIVVIDDLANRQHYCHFLIDQTCGRPISDYSGLVPADCKILLGSEYALLSDGYSSLRAKTLKRRFLDDKVTNVLISIGGLDQSGITLLLLNIFLSLEGYRVIHLVIDASSPIFRDIVKIKLLQPNKIIIYNSISDLSDLVALADVAIGAGGVSAYERACLGLPTLLILTAKNQIHNAQALDSADAIIYLGEYNDFDPVLVKEALSKLINNKRNRINLTLNSARICDGYGASRVSNFLLNRNARVSVGLASEDDSSIIFNWQHQIGSRTYSRNKSLPTQGEHNTWFSMMINDPLCIFNIIMVDDNKVGFVRLNLVDNEQDLYEVSILLSLYSRGKGVGYEALMTLRKIYTNINFYARVMNNNKSSSQLFLKAGYKIHNGSYYNFALEGLYG